MIGHKEERRPLWRKIARRLWAQKRRSAFEYRLWTAGLAVLLVLVLVVPLAAETKLLVSAMIAMWFLVFAHLPDRADGTDTLIDVTTAGIGFVPLALYSSAIVTDIGLPLLCVATAIWWATWCGVYALAVKWNKSLKERNRTHRVSVLRVSLSCLQLGLMIVVLTVL